MSLAIQFYSKEYVPGAVKLAVAYGISSFTVFFSKFIVIISYFALLFYAFMLLAFAVSAAQTGFVPQLGHIFSFLKLWEQHDN